MYAKGSLQQRERHWLHTLDTLYGKKGDGIIGSAPHDDTLTLNRIDHVCFVPMQMHQTLVRYTRIYIAFLHRQYGNISNTTTPYFEREEKEKRIRVADTWLIAHVDVTLDTNAIHSCTNVIIF